jgi:hypothetical protein
MPPISLGFADIPGDNAGVHRGSARSCSIAELWIPVVVYDHTCKSLRTWSFQSLKPRQTLRLDALLLRVIHSVKPLRFTLMGLSLLFAFVPASPVLAEISVSGIISSSETWGVENSPVTITGNVLLESGATLTIDPGVTVKFGSGTSLQIKGELIARGTSGSPIVFTSSQSTPAKGDWGAIDFFDETTDAVFDGNGDYASGSIIKYSQVKYGGGGGKTAAIVTTIAA